MTGIVVATTNVGKGREFQEILGSVAEVIIPDNLPLVEENGATLAENAYRKARSAADFLGTVVVADDSGLFVTALGGAPGVHSARFSGPQGDDASNRAKLLEVLGNATDRSAYFETVLCVCSPSDSVGEARYFHGRCDGYITEKERGTHGFGYDPVFVPAEGDGRTFGEMTSGEKAALSHRARAISKFKAFLAEGSQ